MDLSPGGRRELRRQLAENPDWASDLLAIFGFDIWDAIDGRVPCRRAWSYLDRLVYEPMSVWRAKQMGGPELKDYIKFIGWDAKAYILADIADAIQMDMNVTLAANSKDHKLPELQPYPRPSDKKVEKPSAKLEDFAGTLLNLGLV